MGAAMPMPSVTLWSVKPMTRKVPSPADTGREGRADRKTLAKIVQADTDGDIGGERQPGRSPAVSRHPASSRKLAAATSTTIAGP